MLLLAISCSKNEKKDTKSIEHKHKKAAPYVGNYNTEFNDFPELHAAAAKEKGIKPLALRADTAKYVDKGELVRIPQKVELFKVDELKYSVPYLVPDAAKLLAEISHAFRDSLISKKLPILRLVVTSITRTDEDVAKLMKKNRNAVQESTHRYGTTFDVSWKRFDRDSCNNKSEKVSVDKLKFILGQVLYTLKNQDECYVKHERKQACFHITVR